MQWRAAVAVVSVAGLAGGCASVPHGGFERARTAPIERAIAEVIADRRMPGAVFRLEHGERVYARAFGRLAFDADAPAVGDDTVFDVASLSKVLATAPSVLILAEQGRIDLDAPIVRYFPECAGGGRDGILVRHLLTHTSGLRAGIPATPAWSGRDAAHALACADVPTHPPGTFFRYSDVNYILLGRLVEAVSGQALDAFAERHIFRPLGMRHTSYRPLERIARSRIAPTQQAGQPGDALTALREELRGEVHDPTARRMGGVAGSAGVFSTAADVSRFARMLLGGGTLDGVRILREDSVRLMTTAQTAPGITALRGMGMDIDSPFARPRGSVFPVGSYGHTGFTGCFLWIDPASRTFYVLLSNRVYPDGASNILPLYEQLGTLAGKARH
ncbi:MAG TPA: serine hydrolase domain-containing protein [Telluria sp.]|nr:serine hydrolase domain-containing protein [Telluria sp.]